MARDQFRESFLGTGLRILTKKVPIFSHGCFPLYTRGRSKPNKNVSQKSLRRELQPDIHAWSFPVIWLVENVGPTVAVQVRDPGFVKAEARRENGLLEFAFSVAVENPGRGVWIVGRFGVLGPLGHLGGENVEVAVAVDVSDLEAVPMNHVAINGK